IRLALGALGGLLFLSCVLLWEGSRESAGTQVDVDERQEHRNRSTMLERVRIRWIHGLLEQSTENLARIGLRLAAQPAVLDQPTGLMLHQTDRQSRVLPSSTSIATLFQEMGQS